MKHIHIGKAQALTETYGNILEKKQSQGIAQAARLGFLAKGAPRFGKDHDGLQGHHLLEGMDMMDVEHIPGPGSLFAMDITMDI